MGGGREPGTDPVRAAYFWSMQPLSNHTCGILPVRAARPLPHFLIASYLREPLSRHEWLRKASHSPSCARRVFSKSPVSSLLCRSDGAISSSDNVRKRPVAEASTSSGSPPPMRAAIVAACCRWPLVEPIWPSRRRT